MVSASISGMIIATRSITTSDGAVKGRTSCRLAVGSRDLIEFVVSLLSRRVVGMSSGALVGLMLTQQNGLSSMGSTGRRCGERSVCLCRRSPQHVFPCYHVSLVKLESCTQTLSHRIHLQLAVCSDLKQYLPSDRNNVSASRGGRDHTRLW